ncbi:DUF453 domain-containing protein [Amylocystis lapponica]|nr:DUF453 domain-containing protein [Amylocystis lapponica]
MIHILRRPLSKALTGARAHISTGTSASAIPNPLPASFLRGGTSKGIFLNRADLTDDIWQSPAVFLGIMGSPDSEYGRQLNGMGGGVSSLSKIVIEQGADVEYTFVQVGIRDNAIDVSGNCGNLSSMVGVFALDEGLCLPRIDTQSDPPTATVRCLNTNTNKRIDTTFPVETHNGTTTAMLDLEIASIAGVPGRSSPIISNYISPGGARTGKLLPSSSIDILDIRMPGDSAAVSICASLVDASNPTVILESNEFREVLSSIGGLTLDYDSPTVLGILETIRRLGAERMGLDPKAQAQPKISIVSEPETGDVGVDLVAHTLSMGVLHKAIPMTVGLCLGVAANVEKTLPWAVVKRVRGRQGREGGNMVRIRHPGGTVDVGASVSSEGEVKSAKVLRTGRRLMKGVVWW